MKAIVLRSFGGPEVLRPEDVPRPDPAPGEVLIRVHAVSVNRTLDLEVRRGVYAKPVRLPHVLGVDPAGVVEVVGADVDGVREGDRVAVSSNIRCGRCAFCRAGEDADCISGSAIGVDRWGGYAEFVAVPATNAFVIPASLAFAEASVVVRHFPAAFNLLLNKAELRAGEWVLVMGAAGALGSCGVQVAALHGARVIAAAGSAQRVAAACGYGAEFGVDYRANDLADEVLRITGGRGVDVVFENISDPVLWPLALRSLAPHGRLVTGGAHGGGTVTLDVKRLYLRRLRIIGAAGANRRDIARAITEAGAGRIRATIALTMPLLEAAAAHRLVEANTVVGKVMLDPRG